MTTGAALGVCVLTHEERKDAELFKNETSVAKVLGPLLPTATSILSEIKGVEDLWRAVCWLEMLQDVAANVSVGTFGAEFANFTEELAAG